MLIAYTIGNLKARITTTASTLVAITVTVGSAAVMLALLEGITSELLQSGNPNNVMVLSRTSGVEDQSTLDVPTLNRLKAVQGIAKADGEELISGEAITRSLARRTSGDPDWVVLRGVEPIALKVHDVQITSGALPQRGSPGVIVGKRLLGQFDGLVEGGKIKMGRQQWPVVGVLSAPGTKFESELWCDRTAMLTDLVQKTSMNIAVARAEGPDGIRAIRQGIGQIIDTPLDVLTEPEYYYQVINSGLTLYILVVRIVILVLALGAIFACTNAMYGSFLERTREIATLLAIGYTRRQVAVIVIQEGVFLAFVGTAIGILVSLALNGRSMNMEDMQLAYSARVSATTLILSGAVGVAIAVLGCLATVIQAMRLDVLEALRSG
jgi:putative ABC transport system permease protein